MGRLPECLGRDLLLNVRSTVSRVSVLAWLLPSLARELVLAVDLLVQSTRLVCVLEPRKNGVVARMSLAPPLLVMSAVAVLRSIGGAVLPAEQILQLVTEMVDRDQDLADMGADWPFKQSLLDHDRT